MSSVTLCILIYAFKNVILKKRYTSLSRLPNIRKTCRDLGHHLRPWPDTIFWPSPRSSCIPLRGEVPFLTPSEGRTPSPVHRPGRGRCPLTSHLIAHLLLFSFFLFYFMNLLWYTCRMPVLLKPGILSISTLSFFFFLYQIKFWTLPESSQCDIAAQQKPTTFKANAKSPLIHFLVSGSRRSERDFWLGN